MKEKEELTRSLFLLTKILVTVAVIMSSCVPVKKITYLQHDAEDVGKDSIRQYILKKELYKLKPQDIVSIRVASLTDQEFNFIDKYSRDLGVVRKLGQYSRSINNSVSQGSRGGGGGGGINPGLINQNPGLASVFISQQDIGFTIDRMGNLELPELGIIELAGLTITEAEEKIRDSLNGYFEVPLVRIELLNYDFTVLGEVQAEGRYLSFDPELTVFDAIALAGNIAEFADRENIKIVRKEDGIAKVLYVNLLDESTLASENFYIRRGDIIVVPPLKARTAQRYTVPNISRSIGVIGGLLGVVAVIISLNR